MFLLDTDILSNLIKKVPSPRLIRFLAQTPVEHQFTTAITVGEMVYGASRLPQGEALLKRILEKINSSQVLSFDYAAGLTYGKVRAQLEKKGIIVSEADLRIGSIALTHQMTVITGNLKHFSKIPDLKLDNWL